MKLSYHPSFPSVDDLLLWARKRIPLFALEYLDGGCNDDVNLLNNTTEIRQVELKPYYLREYKPVNLKTELFGQVYDAPFGIAPCRD